MNLRRSHRYAVYFAPSPASLWWDAGCRWLGRDAARGTACPQPRIAGVAPEVLSKITAKARRYGFHATLKAPFRLADGASEAALLALAQSFCATQEPVILDGVRVQALGSFLALRPAAPADAIGALAMRCVRAFDVLRAPLDEAELARRRQARLSERQEALLAQWGYPYVDTEFRFHMTLTDSLARLDGDVAGRIRAAAEDHFSAPCASEPMAVDGLAIFREAAAGAPLSLWRRIGFGPAAHAI
jgi:putative phosphonate metabolism protein